jgi:hypothetical protein
MSLAIEKMNKARAVFMKKSELQEVERLVVKITNVVNNLALGNLPNAPAGTKGGNFNTLTGTELSEYQMLLSGYKFYLADMIADLLMHSQYTQAYIKDYWARNWNRISDEIKEREGKVKNREMIENELTIVTAEEIEEQIFYESEHQRVKLKSFALDDILTVCVQRISELKRQIDTAKNV